MENMLKKNQLICNTQVNDQPGSSTALPSGHSLLRYKERLYRQAYFRIPGNRAKKNEWQRQYNLKNKEKRKQYLLRTKDHHKNKLLQRTYNISLEDYNKMLSIQHNLCAICRKEKKLFVDHNHKTGKVRELLCLQCNSALGCINDNLELVVELKKYLIKHL